MEAPVLIAFAATFFVFAASPGPDNVTIVARTLSHGPASGIAYGLGTTAGILVYLALAAFGLSVLAAEMSTLMTALRYLGGAYLIWMGIRLWTRPAEVPPPEATAARRDVLHIFATGLALNLGNPKMPLFYLALLPNFVTAAFGPGDYLMLASVILGVETVVVGGHVWLASRARGLLKRPAAIRVAKRATGVFLAGAGAASIATARAG